MSRAIRDGGQFVKGMLEATGDDRHGHGTHVAGTVAGRTAGVVHATVTHPCKTTEGSTSGVGLGPTVTGARVPQDSIPDPLQAAHR